MSNIPKVYEVTEHIRARVWPYGAVVFSYFDSYAEGDDVDVPIIHISRTEIEAFQEVINEAVANKRNFETKKSKGE